MSSSADEVLELCEFAGLFLDPWQELVLRGSLGERRDQKWAALEVAVCVSRQNGKGSILEARELGGLFLLGERFITHSAHQFDTSLEAFRRLRELVEGRDEFVRRVKRISQSHGEEGIELYGPKGRRVSGGQRIRFRTRTKGGGRGFTGDLLVLDEAMFLSDAQHGALLPSLSARSMEGNPQIWYTGSAVDKLEHEHGVVFSRIRSRALAGDDPRLAYFEWSVDHDNPATVEYADLMSEEGWALSNPGLGIRIAAEHIEMEQRSMDSRKFAVERLGIGDWFSPEEDGDVISVAKWKQGHDKSSSALDPVCFSLDVSPDRSSSTISAAGWRPDGLKHVETVDRRRGTGWLVDRAVELTEKHESVGFVIDGSGPAGSLIAALEAKKVTVTPVSAREHAQACGLFFDDVEQGRIRHLGTKDLESAVKGAKRRALGEAWAWSRKHSGVDISPLVAATLASWGLETVKPEEPSSWGFVE